ncbi:IclR family transcriptional regulator [Rhodovibrionaceae bacterium A322]
MNAVKTQTQAGVGLLSKAFQILDLFQIDSPTWSQAELVRATDLNRSTVNRLVRYLASSGYLVQVQPTGRYGLGLAAIDLGQRASASFDFRALCQPVLERLSSQIDETILLTALDRSNNSSVCVDQIEGTREGLRVFERIGATFPLHAGAAPKVILAHLPAEEQKAYLAGPLERFTEKTLTDPAALKRDLHSIAAQGYCQSFEETYEGVAGLGAVILGPGNHPLGSIAVALPVQRASSETLGRFRPLLQEAARSISTRLVDPSRTATSDGQTKEAS